MLSRTCCPCAHLTRAAVTASHALGNGIAALLRRLEPFDHIKAVALDRLECLDHAFEHLRRDVVEDDDVTDLLVFTDRKSVVSGKSVSVRVDSGGRRIIKK